MEITNILTKDDKILLLTGNGVRDLKIINLIAEKFNGKNIKISNPSLPKNYSTNKGFSVLKSIDYLIIVKDFKNIQKIILVLDREHIINNNISNLIKEYIHYKQILEEKINDKAWKFTFQRNNSVLELFIVIHGKEKNIEEDINELRKIMGINVQINEKELIKKANLEYIKKVFIGLTAVFDILEKQYLSI